MRLNVVEDVITSGMMSNGTKESFDIHVYDLTREEYTVLRQLINRLHMPRDPPAYDIGQKKPFNYKEFRASFEIVSKGGRWHIMSMEDGKSKGEFDNYDSAVNHLNYICHMADRSGREPL